jgi:hypothetical protein
MAQLDTVMGTPGHGAEAAVPTTGGFGRSVTVRGGYDWYASAADLGRPNLDLTGGVTLVGFRWAAAKCTRYIWPVRSGPDWRL